MKGKTAAIRLIIVLLCAALLLGGIHYFTQEYQIQSALSQMGSRGNEVKAIQEKLKEYGLYNGNVDGIYGSATREAVIRFQKHNGLAADGIAGPATLKKLGINTSTSVLNTNSKRKGWFFMKMGRVWRVHAS